MNYAGRKLISAGSEHEGSNIDDAYLTDWQRELKAQWGSISTWAKRVLQAYRWHYPPPENDNQRRQYERSILMQACKAAIQLDGMIGHWTAQQAVGFAKLGRDDHEAAYWRRVTADPARRAKAKNTISEGLAQIGGNPMCGALDIAAIGEAMMRRLG